MAERANKKMHASACRSGPDREAVPLCNAAGLCSHVCAKSHTSVGSDRSSPRRYGQFATFMLFLPTFTISSRFQSGSGFITTGAAVATPSWLLKRP